MKKILLILVLLFSANVHADDFEEGMTAIKKKDYQKARELFKKVCDGSDPKGCFKLCIFYEEICNRGSTAGCFALGVIYATGKGVPQDFLKAKELYEKACNGGNAAGCFGLGISYATGKGVPQDFLKAKESYKKACDGGLEVGCEKYHSLKQKIEK